MTASKPSTSTDWSKADAYENTPADYEELPELDDAFFDRAKRSQTLEDRPNLIKANSEEAARIARLRDAIVEIWGPSAYKVKEVKRGSDGGLLLSFEPARAEDETIGADDD